MPEQKGRLLKNTPGLDELDHGDDIVCPRLLVLDDGLLNFLASGRRTPDEYLSYLNKEGVEGRLSVEAAKLPTEYAIFVSQEADGKTATSSLRV